MKNYEELYFTIQSNNTYTIKGLITYQAHHPEKDGDLACEYKKINFTNTKKIQIVEGKEIANNVKVTGLNCCSYSAHTEEKILDTMTFEELMYSEYWDMITKKYTFNEEKYKKYKTNSVNEDEEEIYMDCVPLQGKTMSIKFNKITGEMEINSYDTNYYGDLVDLFLLGRNEYDELQQYKKIIDLIRNNHNVQILKNGYVIDDVFYEQIDYYKD